MDDEFYMQAALAIARQGLGRVAPNPTVGCVIVKEGNIIARARTSDSGRPHAEVNALSDVSPEHAHGATVYVTLEPCAHEGETGPCAIALVQADVKKVVVAMRDPDPRVSGKGIYILQQAGIEVVENICSEEAYDLNRGFFYRFSCQRPFVTLKIGSTLDAKIATITGESQWITGDLARARGHLLRAQHDAIAVGVNTVLADNPSLTTRLPGVDHDLIKIVFDTHGRLQGTEKIFESGKVFIVSQCQLNEYYIQCPINDEGVIDLPSAMRALCDRGITRLLVEGGAALISSFLREGIFDQITWFRNSSLIGGDGLSAIQSLAVDQLSQRLSLRQCDHYDLGDDALDIYEKITL